MSKAKSLDSASMKNMAATLLSFPIVRNGGPGRGDLWYVVSAQQPSFRLAVESADRTAALKVREVTAMLKRDGWFLVYTRGSHGQYKHRTKPGKVTVPGKPGEDINPKTLNNIMKQAGLK